MMECRPGLFTSESVTSESGPRTSPRAGEDEDSEVDPSASKQCAPSKQSDLSAQNHEPDEAYKTDRIYGADENYQVLELD